MSASVFNGSYLITHKNHVFNESPEIFLLLERDGPIKGVCVNQWASEETESSGDSNIRMCTEFTDFFVKGGAEFYLPHLKTPLLDGGPHNPEEYFVLHTGYKKTKNTKEYLKGMYYTTPLSEFASTIKEKNYPHYSCIVSGVFNIDMTTFSLALLSKSWATRSGLHAITYGGNLDRKINHIDLLKKAENTGWSEAGLDMGGLMTQLMDFVTEAGVSIIAVGAYGYLKTETDLNDDEIVEATRAMIVVKEAESSDLNDVMKKYTHSELIEKFEKVRENGLKIKLLEEYDARRAMLLDLGLGPFYYDHHVFEVVGLQKQTMIDKLPLTGKAKLLVKSLSLVARIVRGLRGA